MWSWPQPDGVDVPQSDYDAFDVLDRAYESELQPIAGRWHLNGRHQLGGHATFIQHPVEEEVAQAINGCLDAGKFDTEKWNASKDQVKD